MGSTFQSNLFATAGWTEDAELHRHRLDADSWVDHARSWYPDTGNLMRRLEERLDWSQPELLMWDRRIRQPRLSARVPIGPKHLLLDRAEPGRPTPPWLPNPAEPPDSSIEAELASIGTRLAADYDVKGDEVGVTFYRNGADSVAWHADDDGHRWIDTTVALVSLGARRTFRLRPAHGGESISWELGEGDLLVMGGACQRAWEHCVPKRRRAGPRMSLAWRTLGVR